MKKLLLITIYSLLLLLILFPVLFSVYKKEPAKSIASDVVTPSKEEDQIRGIGKFKLYSPISIINNLGYTIRSKKIKDFHDYLKYIDEKYNGNYIVEVTADSITQKNECEGYYNPNVRCFYIPNYKILPKLKITGIWLTFYNDSLISIKCQSNSELEEAFDLKYGKSIPNLKEENNEFVYTYTGNKVTKTNQTFTNKWDTKNENISCSSILDIWYDSEGKRLKLSEFHLYDISIKNKIDEQEETFKNRFSEREKEKKKQSLGGL